MFLYFLGSMGAVLRFLEGSEHIFSSLLVLDHEIQFSLGPMTWIFIFLRAHGVSSIFLGARCAVFGFSWVLGRDFWDLLHAQSAVLIFLIHSGRGGEFSDMLGAGFWGF